MRQSHWKAVTSMFQYGCRLGDLRAGVSGSVFSSQKYCAIINIRGLGVCNSTPALTRLLPL